MNILLQRVAFVLLGLGQLARAAETPAPTTPAPRRQPAYARVLVVQDPEATVAFNPRAEVVQSMVNRAIRHFTGETNLARAWGTLLATNDTIGIKVCSTPGAISGTRPSVVAAVVEGLLAAKIPARQIVIWDKQLVDLRLAGYGELAERYGVRLAAAGSGGFDEQTFYEKPLLGQLVFGDLEFGRKETIVGRKSFVAKLVSQQLTKIIHISPLLNHHLAGVSGNLVGLALGSVDNTIRFESDGDRLAESVPEIYALPALGDRVVLNIVDALICQYEGRQQGLLHYSSTLNQLRFSTDPVALDVLSLEELNRQRERFGAPAVTNQFELYRNASLLELGVSDFGRIQVEAVP